MRSLLAAWLEQEQMSMEEAAAALLKLAMGEESEEIPEAEQRERNRRRDNADAGRSARNRKGAGRDGSRTDRNRKNAGGDGARTERTRKNDGRNSKRADEAKRSAGKGNSGVRADRAMKNTGRDGSRTERTESGRANAGIAEERKKQMPPKDLRTDGTPAPEKRRRHDHTGQRKKLMTGENKDYGYDTDASVYHRPDIHPGHTLEIKTKEEDGRSAQKKTAKKRTFRLFGKK